MSNYKKIYIKPVGNTCNLSCLGCYVSSIPELQPKLDLNIVKTLINDLTNENPNIEIEIVFHGGEPFVINDDETIQSYINLIKDFPNVKWTATTNLIYSITPKLLELFNLFTNKFIKTSWDPIGYRFKDLLQLQIWENNVKFLINEGFIIQSIICVTTNIITFSPSVLFDYFKKLGLKDINFERITRSGRAIKNNHIVPTNRTIDQWLFECYIQNKDNYKFNIPLFKELIEIQKGATALGCRLRRCTKDVITLENDGTRYSCPNTCGNTDLETLKQNEKLLHDFCKMCKYFKWCNGECFQLEYDETGCPGLRQIMENLSNNV